MSRLGTNSNHVLWQSGCSDSAAMEQSLLSSLDIYRGYHEGWVDNYLIYLNKKIPRWWQDQYVFPRLSGCWVRGARDGGGLSRSLRRQLGKGFVFRHQLDPSLRQEPLPLETKSGLLSLPFEDSLPSFILKFSKDGEVPFSGGLKRLFLLFLINFLSKLSRKKSLSVWGRWSLCQPPGKQPWPLRAKL